MTKKVVSKYRPDRRIINKQGKRKCYICKNTFPLTKEFFYEHNNEIKNKGFRWACIKCEIPYVAKRTAIKNRQWRINFILDRKSKCEKCGLKNRHPSFFEIDHIIPVLTDRRNVSMYDKSERQLLCPNCHKLKTIEERESGLFHRNKNRYV